MALTARKLKRLRKERKVTEKVERLKTLVLLGAEQKDLLARLGHVEKPRSVLCPRCGWMVGALYTLSGVRAPATHKCIPSKQWMKSLTQSHDRLKFLKKMGIDAAAAEEKRMRFASHAF